MDNPKKVEVELNTGDVVIVPAGVCHRMVEETRRPFMMVGSYPEGCEWDMCYGTQGEEGKVDRIRGLVWLKADPIYGDGGPAVGVWKEWMASWYLRCFCESGIFGPVCRSH